MFFNVHMDTDREKKWMMQSLKCRNNEVIDSISKIHDVVIVSDMDNYRFSVTGDHNAVIGAINELYRVYEMRKEWSNVRMK